MTGVIQVRNAFAVQQAAQLGHLAALLKALGLADLEMRNGRLGRSGHGRGQGGREDEPAGKGADKVTQRSRSRDVAAHAAERLAERAFNEGDAIGQPFALRYTAAAPAIEPHGMHLIEIGHGAVLFGHLNNLAHRADIAVHRIDALKRDNLGCIGGKRRQFTVQVFRVVVLPDHLLAARVTDAFDH